MQALQVLGKVGGYISKRKKTYSESEYGNLLAAYVSALKTIDSPAGEIVRLKAHIAFMEEEAKNLHERYLWVCQRLEELERK